MNDSTSKKATLKIKKIIVSFFKIIVVIALIFLAFEIGRSKLLQNNRYQKSTAASIITNVDNKIQTSNELNLPLLNITTKMQILMKITKNCLAKKCPLQKVKLFSHTVALLASVSICLK